MLGMLCKPAVHAGSARSPSLASLCAVASRPDLVVTPVVDGAGVSAPSHHWRVGHAVCASSFAAVLCSGRAGIQGSLSIVLAHSADGGAATLLDKANSWPAMDKGLLADMMLPGAGIHGQLTKAGSDLLFMHPWMRLHDAPPQGEGRCVSRLAH